MAVKYLKVLLITLPLLDIVTKIEGTWADGEDSNGNQAQPNVESRGTPATSVLSPPTWERTHPPPLKPLSATRT